MLACYESLLSKFISDELTLLCPIKQPVSKIELQKYSGSLSRCWVPSSHSKESIYKGAEEACSKENQKINRQCCPICEQMDSVVTYACGISEEPGYWEPPLEPIVEEVEVQKNPCDKWRQKQNHVCDCPLVSQAPSSGHLLFRILFSAML